MRVLATLSLLFALVGTSAFAGDPYPFQRSDGKWGYVNDDHCWVVEPQFEGAWKFSDGLAQVAINGKRGFIDEKGVIAINPQFDWAFGFSEGLAAVQLGAKWGFVDTSGTMVIAPQFDGVGIFSHGFSEGLAAVEIGNKLGFIDQSGKVVVNPQFEYVQNFSENIAAVRLDEKWRFIRKPNYLISENYYLKLGSEFNNYYFSEGLILAHQSGKFGFIDANEKWIIDAKFDDAKRFSEGLAAVKLGANWGFIDKKGKVAINPKFEYGWSFSEGLSAVKFDGKWGFIDKDGTMIIGPQFDAMYSSYFENGRAMVTIGNRNYAIDHSGLILLDPTCDMVP